MALAHSLGADLDAEGVEDEDTLGALRRYGCNITQGLTNSATLALGSLTAFASMLAGGWVALSVLFSRRG